MASTSTLSPQNDQTKSQLKLHLIVFIWGFTAILGELIQLDAFQLVFYRILISLGVLWPYFVFIRKAPVIPKKDIILLLLCGGIIALHWVTFFHAIKISNISITLACLSSGSLFAALFEPLFFKRKIRGYEILLGLLIIFGISTIFAVETDYWFGIITALVSAALAALFGTINGLWVKKYNGDTVSTYELTGGVLFLLVILLVSGNGNTLIPFNITLSDWGYLVVLGTVCTAYPFIESVNIMRHLSPFTVILTINLEPVYGILMAFLLFGDAERMSPSFYLGAAIILLAVVLNGIIARKRKKKLMTEVS